MTKNQMQLLIQIVCDEIDSTQDYINDGTFDDDQDEKDEMEMKVDDLIMIRESLKQQLSLLTIIRS